ncbi:MAG: MFS transporter [Calditrichaeota bacterium]|nr:MAG: MFS transporter [Calditrichota bacterium]
MADLSRRHHPFPEKHERLQPLRLTALSLGHFTNDMYVGFLAPLLPLIMDKLGIRLTAAAALTSVLAVFTSLAQPAFGHLADRLKFSYLAIFGPLITAIFFSCIGLVDSYAMLIVMIVLAGFGTAAFHPQAASLAGKSSGRQNGFGMSLFVTGGNAGYYLGPIVIMAIVTQWGLQYSFIAILPGLLISAFLFWAIPHLPQSIVQQAKQVETNKIPHALPAFIILFCISMLRSFVVSGFNTFIPLFLHERQFTPMMYAAGLSAFGLPGAVGSLLAGSISDRWGRKRYMLFSLAAALPFLGLFLHLPGVYAMICLSLGGFFILSSIPVVIITAQELFPHRVNTASSLVMGLSWGIGGIMVTPLAAFSERYSLSHGLHLLLVVNLLACLLVLFLPETKRV